MFPFFQCCGAGAAGAVLYMAAPAPCKIYIIIYVCLFFIFRYDQKLGFLLSISVFIVKFVQ